MTILFELVANNFAYDKFYVNKVYPDKYTMSFFICPLPPKSSYCARRIVERLGRFSGKTFIDIQQIFFFKKRVYNCQFLKQYRIHVV